MLSLRKTLPRDDLFYPNDQKTKKKSLDFGLCSQPDNNTIEGQDI